MNDIGALWPESEFRQNAFRAAQMWIDQMKSQGYELLTAESDILLFGPYKPRNYTGAMTKSWSPSVHPEQKRTYRTFGERMDEDLYEDSADFVLEARFLASRIRLVEHDIKPAAGVA